MRLSRGSCAVWSHAPPCRPAAAAQVLAGQGPWTEADAAAVAKASATAPSEALFGEVRLAAGWPFLEARVFSHCQSGAGTGSAAFVPQSLPPSAPVLRCDLAGPFVWWRFRCGSLRPPRWTTTCSSFWASSRCAPPAAFEADGRPVHEPQGDGAEQSHGMWLRAAPWDVSCPAASSPLHSLSVIALAPPSLLSLRAATRRTCLP